MSIVSSAGRHLLRADFVYPSTRTIVELDGYAWHADVVAFQKDRWVQNELVALGYSVYRYTWWDLDLRSGVVTQQMRAAAQPLSTDPGLGRSGEDADR